MYQDYVLKLAYYNQQKPLEPEGKLNSGIVQVYS